MSASTTRSGTVGPSSAGGSARTASEFPTDFPTRPNGTEGRSRRIFVVFLVSSVLLLGLGAAVLFAVASVVEVQVDGEVLATRTFAAEVGQVLDELGVELGDADRVEPVSDAWVEDGMQVVVHRAVTVEVVIDAGAPLTLVTTFGTVGEVLREAGMEDLLAGGSRIDPAPGEPIADGARIIVEVPVAVTIAVGGEEREVVTHAGTVAGAIEEAGVQIGDDDLVEPPRDSALDGATRVTVRRVQTRDEVIEVPIEHGEVRRDTDELVEGESRVESPGRDGLRRETYEITLVDGDASGRVLVAEEVVREPEDQLVLVGTAPGPVRQAQRLLADLGYPVGPVDGIEGAQTRRGLCAWRRLEGHDVSRGALQADELEALMASSGLPAAPSGRGVTVDRTCQVVFYRQDGGWQNVHQASTGADGLPREGSYVIRRALAGWHTSTLYPSPTPNMYNSLYFHGAIAIHGSNNVPAHPASSGCVRVTPDAADQLFGDLRIGDPVRVIGAF